MDSLWRTIRVSLCASLSPRVSLYVSLSPFLSVSSCLSLFLFVSSLCLVVSISLFLSLCPLVSVSICLSFSVFASLSVSVSLCLSVSLYIYYVVFSLCVSLYPCPSLSLSLSPIPRLPSGFWGAALRCLPAITETSRSVPAWISLDRDQEDLQELLLLQLDAHSSGQEPVADAKWIFLSPKQLISGGRSTRGRNWGVYSASQVIAFTSRHVCSIVVLYTPKQLQAENPLVYLRSVSLKALP